MLDSDSQPNSPPTAPALPQCPECSARRAILRIITGRSGCEYWTMRCTGCGAIHLDIVNPVTEPQAS